LFNMRLEWGEFDDLGNSDWNRIPTDQRWFSGLQDLREHDAFRLFRDGEVAVDQFAAPHPTYCHLLEPTDSLLIRATDVVVQRQERDRVERQHGLAGATRPAVTSVFRHVNDYREVRVAGRVSNLGHVQSRAVKQPHRAAITGDPWCSGKVLLAGAGSSSTRVADLFKSQRDWRQLIESDRRGNYRLRLLFSDPHQKPRRAAALAALDPPAIPRQKGFDPALIPHASITDPDDRTLRIRHPHCS
jgi:hypothetical protein